MWHDSLTCVTRLGWLRRRSMCDVTRLCVRHDSDVFLCATWLVYVWNMTGTSFYVRRGSFMCVTWLGHLSLCDVTRLYVRRDSEAFTYATWLVYVCDMTRVSVCDMTTWHVWHYLSTCVVKLVDVCDTTRLYTSHDRSLKMIGLFCKRALLNRLYSSKKDLWLVDMCDTTCLCMWHGSLMCVIRSVMCLLTHITSHFDMIRRCMWYDSIMYVCVTWLDYMWDMTCLHVWYDS